MKTLKNTILSIGAVALLGAGGLYAQDKATVQVPFDFSVQGITLPAGEYAMKSTSMTSGTLSIWNVQTRHAVSVLAPSNVSELKASKNNIVLFHQIGDHYFLAEVKTDRLSGHVSPSKMERELVSEGSGQPVAAVIVPALGIR